MTDEEKIAIFEENGVTDGYIDDVERRLASGEFFEGEWETVPNPSAEPVVLQIRVMPYELDDLDRRADARGKTRNQLARELLNEGLPVRSLIPA